MISQTMITMDCKELQSLIKLHYNKDVDVLRQLAEDYNIGPYGCFWYVKVLKHEFDIVVSNDTYHSAGNTLLETWIEEAEELLESEGNELDVMYYICRMIKDTKLPISDYGIWIEY